jgi:hypothetical protein
MIGTEKGPLAPAITRLSFCSHPVDARDNHHIRIGSAL